MSNPVARRLAKAAFLLAAGAAPLLGTAGQAAAADQGLRPDLAGLTALDGNNLSGTVDTAAGTAAELTGEVGGEAVRTAVPAVTPLAQETTADASATTGSALRTVAPLVSGS